MNQLVEKTYHFVLKPLLLPLGISLAIYLCFVITSSIFHGTFTCRFTENAILFSIVMGFGTVWVRRALLNPDERYTLGMSFFFFYLLLFLIPGFLIAYIYYHTTHNAVPFYTSSRSLTFIPSVFMAVFFARALIHLLIPNERVDKVVRFIGSISLFFFLVFVFALLVYPLQHHATFDASAVKLIMHSSISEALEYMVEYSANLEVLMFLMVCYCGFFKGFTLFYDHKRYPPLFVGIVDSLLLIMAVGSCIISRHNNLYDVKVTWDEMKTVEAMADKHDPADPETLKSSVEPIDGVYVMVIGESLHRRHMSAYGYERKTTPFLDHMLEIYPYNVIFFESPYACDDRTETVLMRALTAMNQYNSKEFMDSPSLIETAKANNFDTYWISNQSQFNWQDTEVTFLAHQSDVSIFASNDLTTIQNPYDGDLLPYLEKIKDIENGLVIVHLYGSHFRYESRYPPEFEKFQDGTKLDYYDNSVFYNDYVLKRIFDTFKDNPKFNALMYFSDHGNSLGDMEFDGYNEHNVEIPMYIILSGRYLEVINPDTLSALLRSSHEAITNDLIFNTMLSLMHIRVDSLYEPENDPFSLDYDGSYERLKTMLGKYELVP